MTDERQFPVLHHMTRAERDAGIVVRRSVPWAFLQPHESQALTNHDQTLERLAERGGLGLQEMVCVVERKRWRELKNVTLEYAIARIDELVAQWERNR